MTLSNHLVYKMSRKGDICLFSVSTFYFGLLIEYINMLSGSKNTPFSHTTFPLCLKHSVLAPVSFRPLLLTTPIYSDWSAHTHPSQHRSPCRLSVRMCFQFPVSLMSTIYIGIRYANLCRGDSVWCQEVAEIKGGATDEAFQEQYFLWDGGASVGVDIDI